MKKRKNIAQLRKRRNREKLLEKSIKEDTHFIYKRDRKERERTMEKHFKCKTYHNILVNELQDDNYEYYPEIMYECFLYMDKRNKDFFLYMSEKYPYGIAVLSNLLFLGQWLNCDQSTCEEIKPYIKYFVFKIEKYNISINEMLEATTGYGAIFNPVVFEELFYYAIRKDIKIAKNMIPYFFHSYQDEMEKYILEINAIEQQKKLKENISVQERSQKVSTLRI